MSKVKHNECAGLQLSLFDRKGDTRRVEEYLRQSKEEIHKTVISLESSIREFAGILKQARALHREIMFFGSEQDYHIINHANVDFLKMNGLRVVSLGAPAITAFGNDYPFPGQLKEVLKLRNFGNQDVLVGIQLGEKNTLLGEAFKYNNEHGGINILISNIKEFPDYAGLNIFIDTANTFMARDIAQIILHFISVNIARETHPGFRDEGAKSFSQYCRLLLESIDGLLDVSSRIAEISLSIQMKLMDGNAVFAFGNGGSSAIASFFADGLREVLDNSLNTHGRIFDVPSFVGHITKSINRGYYKSDAFTRLVQGLGVHSGDVLLGISSSGNSKNILHPFMHLKDTVRIGILGFDDGGTIGRADDKDLAVIVPDAGGFKSYQRAEDGQRIVVSAILNSYCCMI